MKMNYWLILGVLVATGATAQTPTNMTALPPIPAPANIPTVSTPILPPTNVVTSTSAPAKPAKKKIVKKKKTVAKAAPKKPAAPLAEANAALNPGPAEVVASNLNMRGQAGLKGEVVGHVQKGDMVTVVSEITLDKHRADEPAQWAKVLLPSSGGVWVRSSFINPTNNTVLPKKLNLRGGPGENYSVLGVIERGTPVVVSSTKGEWSKIETPTNAYAFIAAMYLKQESSGNLAINPPPSTETMPAPLPPTAVNVGEGQPINTAPGNPTMGLNSVPPPSLTPPPVMTPTVIIQTNIIMVTDTNVPPPPPRVVTHDGYVRSSVSPVAPTYFELYDPGTDVAINYLFSTTTNLDLARYKGYHVNVTGEEGMDARWKDTPVLTVQKIYVVGTNAPAETAAATADTKKKKAWYHLW
jgi:uncharacterized protein YgiM (DUF1202 family)